MTRRIRITASILATAALLIAMEQSIPALYRQLPIGWREWDRVEKRKEAIRQPTDYDVLVFGDSTGVQGIIPAAFEEATGKKTYNLSTYADRNDLGDIALLNEYLDRHPPPEAIVVVRSILSWYIGYAKGIVQYEFNRPDVVAMLLRRGFMSWPEAASLYLKQLLPSLSYRNKFAFLRRALSDEKVWNENLLKYMDGDGWDGYEPFNPQYHATNLELTEKTLAPYKALRKEDGTLNLTAYSLPLLDELCQTATKRGIRMFVAFNPNDRLVQDDPTIAASVKELMEKIGGTLEASSPNCQLIHNLWIMDKKYLSDLTHTNHEGAIVYTKMVAEEFMKMK